MDGELLRYNKNVRYCFVDCETFNRLSTPRFCCLCVYARPLEVLHCKVHAQLHLLTFQKCFHRRFLLLYFHHHYPFDLVLKIL